MPSSPQSRRSMPMDVDAGPALPFPGPDYAKGVTDSKEDIPLARKSKAELKELCKRFRLGVSGNKATLTGRLKDFSGNEAKWKDLLPRVHQKHLGPSEGRVAKNKSHLAKRIEMMRAELNGGGSPSESMVTAEDRGEAILAWARDVVQRNPYMPLEERRKPKALLSAPFALPVGHASGSASERPVPLSTFPMSISAPIALAPVVPLQGSAAPIQRSLTLTNGKVLLFTSIDVPPPPSAQFSKDIPLLGQMWDDRLPGWSGKSYLTIKNTPITLVYWKEVYSGRHRGDGPNHWHILKPRWLDWKARFKVALHWNQGTPEQFWSRFSDAEGNHMDYTTTLRAIQHDRKKDDEELVKRAREEYGSRFDQVFTYRKGGTRHVLTKDVDIAKKYRILKGGNSSESD